MRLNLLILSLAALVALSASATLATPDEGQPLFNGKNLNGWTSVNGPIESWSVEDGLLVCSGAGGGWLSTKKQYDDFVLELEFRVPEGGNSGVFLRAPHEGDPAYTGLEIQVLDDAAEEYAELRPDQYTGSVYGIAAAKPRATKPAGEWQSMRIECSGRNVTVEVNGKEVVDTNLDDHGDKVESHPGLTRSTGHIGLQNHGSRVEYRNVRIKPGK